MNYWLLFLLVIIILKKKKKKKKWFDFLILFDVKNYDICMLFTKLLASIRQSFDEIGKSRETWLYAGDVRQVAQTWLAFNRTRLSFYITRAEVHMDASTSKTL